MRASSFLVLNFGTIFLDRGRGSTGTGTGSTGGRGVSVKEDLSSTSSGGLITTSRRGSSGCRGISFISAGKILKFSLKSCYIRNCLSKG